MSPIRFFFVALLLLSGVGGYYLYQHIQFEKYIRRTVTAIQSQEWDQAAQELNQARKIEGSDPKIELLAARLARKQHKYSLARQHLDTCLRLGGPVDRILLERYLLRFLQSDAESVEKKLLTFVHREDVDTTEIIDVLTEKWLLDFHFHDVEGYLNQWLRIQPNARDPKVRRAWLKEKRFDFAQAIEEYQTILEENPEADQGDRDRVRRRLAELLLENQKPTEAMEHWELLYQRYPKDRTVVMGLVRCRRLLGKSIEASHVLDVYLNENPDEGIARGERGLIGIELGHEEQAERDLQMAIDRVPYEKPFLNGLFLLLQRKGKSEEANRILARLESIKEDEKQMQQLMRESLRSPEEPRIKVQIGEIFIRNGMTKDAIRWYQAALSIDPKCTLAHEKLAIYYESQKMLDQALPHRRAIDQLQKSK